MDVKLPNGQTLRGVPDGTTKQQLAEKLAKNGFAVPKEWMPPTPQENTWGNAIKNVGEAGLHFGSGMLGGVVGDVAGLGAMGVDSARKMAEVGKMAMNAATGKTDPVSLPEVDPAAVRDKVSSALTYEPSNPESLSNKIGTFPGKIIQGAGEGLANVTGTADVPVLGDIVRAAPLAAANYLGFKGAKAASLPRAAAEEIAPTAAQEAAAKAAEAGYKITPTQVNAKVGGAIEGMVGQPKLERSLSLSNAKVTDTLAKKFLGLEDKTELTPKTFEIEKAKENRAYDAVSKTGTRKTSDAYREEIANINDRSGAGSFPEDTPPAVERLKSIYEKVPFFSAKDAVAKIRQLRSDAGKNIKALNDPERNALGYAQKKVAAALDNELARHVETLGKPELSQAYQAARIRLAKLHSVEDAMQGTNVSAKKIWQQRERGVPVSGELSTIADTYSSFGKVLQDVSKIRHSGPFSVVDYVLGVGGAAHSPALAAAIAARPLARAALASKAYQRSLTNLPKVGEAGANASKAAQALATAAKTNPLILQEAEARRRAAQ